MWSPSCLVSNFLSKGPLPDAGATRSHAQSIVEMRAYCYPHRHIGPDGVTNAGRSNPLAKLLLYACRRIGDGETKPAAYAQSVGC